MKIAITGATSGIGTEKVKALAPLCEQMFLLVRDEKKARDLIQSLPSHQEKISVIYCDLSDLSSVAKTATTLSQKTTHLDVLINNAGGIFPDKTITTEGHELTFCVNHLGHFLLTYLTMPLLTSDKGGKIISVSSEAHRAAKVNEEDLELKNDFSSFKAYANVKLYNLLFTKSLAEKFNAKKIEAYALHPGVVNTNFGTQSKGIFKFLLYLAKPFMISPKEGAQTGIHLATHQLDPKSNGGYFKKRKLAKASKDASSKKLRDLLWAYSLKQIEPYLSEK
ncbi:SDR family NAD(P)-dependent oxidoreductase [Cyclobacterium marinum]|uniref:Short-chain dehydrogenase/reductase SDR n=1 Tax=Cyclobacterium marinum (strain ATCC 25205 / DSM 745 / LMG 13164 / NCIMB 1802) TaxID=880070 RepID=G0IYL5_CYCMS|nr:SDR family NAD(P)-dependent oxidoreductase [Cyclobacterium marinum]AEL26438.1 short-chain dehydrogenase/reductase SDR [Cyclobacterium marinum DSM 745]MBR9775113.1 SDR family NAD(P)-dependent oxidoreductase [Cytophagales bacterium]|tara:strand:- start:32426 stop:33262 length:837 start_codon:yes stop_codon:yes gene_type:complete